ncbi:MAG: hypothetical protein VKJ46_11925 [Leptolyngbyaceae bacterium]|nr:hypothetical protein [Leptolyngbyaceae bacterium]
MLLGITGCFGLLPHRFAIASQPTIQLTTEPSIGKVLPFKAGSHYPQTPVMLTLQASDGAGQPLKNARIDLQVFTPPQNPWFPTDFPIVEGTQLLELTALAPTGKLQFQQMLPIRGTYQVRAQVSPVGANAFSPFQQTLTLSVAEHPIKYRNFAILMVLLLTAGVGGGWIMGGKQSTLSDEVAPERVRLLLSGAIVVAIAALLIINISAEVADSHTNHSPTPRTKTKTPASVESQDIKLTFTGDESATVGRPATLAVQARDLKTGKPVTDLIFKVKITEAEDGWVAFAYTGSPNASGQLTWKQQFFDGAPHKIDVEVSPSSTSTHQFPPMRISREIEVEGVAPPMFTRLIVLGYFTGVLLLGVGLGLGLKQKLVEPG